ncbi:MAG: hypothetical protein MUC59_18575 [Saprospiraceae bacterium]|jgi:hypothetical protein|nr:hypothetical protein [Saprospiraceae bacterium]
MGKKSKAEMLAYVEQREVILKSRLQYYVRWRLEIKEGPAYADEQINAHLDELKIIWEIKNLLKDG